MFVLNDSGVPADLDLIKSAYYQHKIDGLSAVLQRVGQLKAEAAVAEIRPLPVVADRVLTLN